MAGRFGLWHEGAASTLYGNCETGDFHAWSLGGRAGEPQAKQGGAGMKRLFMLPIAVLAAVLVAVAAGASTQTIQVTKNGFTPQSSTVNVGDTVTWHNADTADHQVVADDGSFASPVLHADQTYSHTFSSAGAVKYHDSFAKTHSGTIAVQGAAPTLTLSSASSTSVYCGGTALKGSVSSALPSEPVTLTAQAFGKSTQ